MRVAVKETYSHKRWHQLKAQHWNIGPDISMSLFFLDLMNTLCSQFRPHIKTRTGWKHFLFPYFMYLFIRRNVCFSNIMTPTLKNPGFSFVFSLFPLSRGKSLKWKMFQLQLKHIHIWINLHKENSPFQPCQCSALSTTLNLSHQPCMGKAEGSTLLPCLGKKHCHNLNDGESSHLGACSSPFLMQMIGECVEPHEWVESCLSHP